MNRRIVVHLVGGRTVAILGETYAFINADTLEIYQGESGGGKRNLVATFLRPHVVGVCDADAVVKDEGDRGPEGPATAVDTPTFGEQRVGEERRKALRPDEGPAAVGGA